jgi:hypothetical protein
VRDPEGPWLREISNSFRQEVCDRCRPKRLPISDKPILLIDTQPEQVINSRDELRNVDTLRKTSHDLFLARRGDREELCSAIRQF